jgi:hypothetical protein
MQWLQDYKLHVKSMELSQYWCSYNSSKEWQIQIPEFKKTKSGS